MFKTLLAGAALLMIAGAASAQTVIRFTGATAFRENTVNAIRAAYDSGTLTYGYVGSSFASARYHIFKGNISGQNVTVKTSWSGAVDGHLAIVSGDTSVKYLEDGGTTLSAALTSVGTANLTDNTAAAGVASDVAMLDHFPASTPFVPPTYPAMSVTPVGVVSFKYFASRGKSAVTVTASTTSGSNSMTVSSAAGLAPGMTISGPGFASPPNAKISTIVGTTITVVKNTDGTAQNATNNTTNQNHVFVTPCPIDNMNEKLAKALWSTGTMSLAMFTGNPDDQDEVVWAMGRDAASGTRLVTHQENGVGYNSQITQFQNTISGGVVTSHALATNSASVLPAIVAQHPNVGDGGYPSGSNIAAALAGITSNPLDVDGLPHGAPTGPTATGYYLSYVTVTPDSVTAANNGAKELTWNGVQYSEENVRQGKYTFWGYENLAYLNSLSGVKKSVADTVANLLITTHAPNPKLGDMDCLRTTDGAPVLQNY